MGRAERRAYAKKMNKLGYKGEKCPLCNLNTEFIVAEETPHSGIMNAYCMRCGKPIVTNLQRPGGSTVKLKDIQEMVDDGHASLPLKQYFMKQEVVVKEKEPWPELDEDEEEHIQQEMEETGIVNKLEGDTNAEDVPEVAPAKKFDLSGLRRG